MLEDVHVHATALPGAIQCYYKTEKSVSQIMRRITNRSRLMAGPGYWYFIVAFCIVAMDLCGICFQRRYLCSYNGQ